MKKIILVGNWAWDHCEKAFSEALQEHNFIVKPFVMKTDQLSKISRVFPLNFFIQDIQDELIEMATAELPDFIFLWNATHINPKTIALLKRKDIKVITYSNDDPYITSNKPLAQQFLWRNFLKYIKYSDFHFVYRPINIDESKKYTNSRIYLLPPYFIPEVSRNIELNKADITKFYCDIIFIGHYEADYRADYLESIFDHGYDIKLFGTGWNEKAPVRIKKKFGKIARLDQVDYFKALSLSKICLAFLSKFNRDVYTRRCFEIPGSGNLLLCERTDYMKKLFKEDEEAVFFDSREEMLNKINWLLSEPGLIDRISKAGHERVNKDGHNIKARAGYFVDLISEKSHESL